LETPLSIDLLIAEEWVGWMASEVLESKRNKIIRVQLDMVANKGSRDCPYVLKHRFRKGLQDM
jgi:hypothetical protein